MLQIVANSAPDARFVSSPSDALVVPTPAAMPPAGGVGETAGQLIGVIGDEETVTGMLLAGVGEMDNRGKKNFYVVTASAPPPRVPVRARPRTRRAELPCAAGRFGLQRRGAGRRRARTRRLARAAHAPPLLPNPTPSHAGVRRGASQRRRPGWSRRRSTG